MIGLWADSAAAFLIVLAAVSTIAFALPLTLVPLSWARVLGWRLPEHTDLAVYFGRCLGALALVIQILTVRAALTGDGIEVMFQLLIGGAALICLVHVWGALRRIQPASETWEIAYWGPLALLGLLFYPA